MFLTLEETVGFTQRPVLTLGGASKKELEVANMATKEAASKEHYRKGRTRAEVGIHAELQKVSKVRCHVQVIGVITNVKAFTFIHPHLFTLNCDF